MGNAQESASVISDSSEDSQITLYDSDESPPPEPSRRHPYVTAALILLCCFFNYICIYLIAPFYPYEAKNKKGSTADTEVGFVMGIIQFSGFIGSVFVGKYFESLGPRLLIISGAFLVGGCSLLFGFIGNINTWVCFLGLSLGIRFVMGFGEAAFDMSSLALMLAMFPSHATTTWGFVELAIGLGFVAGPPLGGTLYTFENFMFPFLVTGGLVLMTTILLLVLLWNMPPCHLIDASRPVTQVSMWLLIKMPPVTVVCVSVFLSSATLGLLNTSLAVYLKHTFGWSTFHIGLVFLITGGSYMIMTVIGGPLVDATKPKIVMMLGLLIESSGIMMIGPSFEFLDVSPENWLVYVGMALFGSGASLVVISAAPDIMNYAIVRGYECGGALNGMVSGLVLAVVFLGGAIGSPVGGALTAAYDFHHSSSYFGFAILGQLAIVAILFLVELVNQARRQSVN
jgi:MFS family permease